MFALWPMGRYGDILGHNHKHKILILKSPNIGKLYN
jgi:hypothetical protein